jgi:hypothetical protein
MKEAFAIVGMIAILFAGKTDSDAKYLLAIAGGIFISIAVYSF